MKKQIKKGFTLIELLIVVAIIGILAVALVPTITDAPARARDAARKASVNSILSSLESYNIDNGSYPDGNFCIYEVPLPANANGLELVNDYLNDNPPSQTEPSNGVVCADGDNAFVRYEGDGTSYTVFMELENAGNFSLGTFAETSETTFDNIYDESNVQVFAVQR
jgi:prepilin-type N-terminal cleavage/methylation domain-containing protein